MLVPYSSICSAWELPSRPVIPWTTRRVSFPTRIPIRLRSLRQCDDLAGRFDWIRFWHQRRAFEDFEPFLGAGTGHPVDDWHFDVEALDGCQDAASDGVAARDAAE